MKAKPSSKTEIVTARKDIIADLVEIIANPKKNYTDAKGRHWIRNGSNAKPWTYTDTKGMVFASKNPKSPKLSKEEWTKKQKVRGKWLSKEDYIAKKRAQEATTKLAITLEDIFERYKVPEHEKNDWREVEVKRGLDYIIRLFKE